MLKDEYLRTLDRVKALLAARPRSQTLIAGIRSRRFRQPVDRGEDQ